MNQEFAGLEDLSFDHVALAVRDIRATLPLVRLLGGEFLQGADHLRNGFRWVQFRLPGASKLELIQPLSEKSFLSKFLLERGEGVHHLTFRVTDVEEAAGKADRHGYRTTGLHLHPEWSEVFLHPRSAHGVLIQLAAWPDSSSWEGASLESVMAGESIDRT